eukprot:scaffold47578_cov69-Phaeocystis_antarctica.AAC.1
MSQFPPLHSSVDGPSQGHTRHSVSDDDERCEVVFSPNCGLECTNIKQTVNSNKHDPPGSTKVGQAQISEVGGPTFDLPVSEARGLLALGPAPLVLVRVVVGALVRGRVGVRGRVRVGVG